MNPAEITLRSVELELVFEPEQGGKWRSLRDRRTGREWLWQNPHLPVTPISYGDSYIEKLDTGGWDEVFPSVSPYDHIPDHGDLVQLPWQVIEHGDNRLTMSVEGRCFPFQFERTVTLRDAHVRCAYRLENTGTLAFPWLWCAHPLLPLSPEFTLEVAGWFQAQNAMGTAEALAGKRVQWHELPDLEEPWAVKLFSERGGVKQTAVRHADGSGLRFAWDADKIPYLGLWVNNGAWAGCGSQPYHNIGIEPATLPVDDLRDAEDPPILEPGSDVVWALEVSLT